MAVYFRGDIAKATPSIDMSGYKDGKLKTPYADRVIENYQLARLIGAGNDAVGPNGGLTYTFYEDEDCKDLVDNGLTGGRNTAQNAYYNPYNQPQEEAVTTTTPLPSGANVVGMASANLGAGLAGGNKNRNRYQSGYNPFEQVPWGF